MRAGHGLETPALTHLCLGMTFISGSLSSLERGGHEAWGLMEIGRLWRLLMQRVQESKGCCLFLPCAPPPPPRSTLWHPVSVLLECRRPCWGPPERPQRLAAGRAFSRHISEFTFQRRKHMLLGPVTLLTDVLAAQAVSVQSGIAFSSS